MQIIVLDKKQWVESYSELAHKLCFNETGFAELDRCDYALLVVDNEEPLMYATIKELDALSGYMQRGGAFPSVKGSTKSYKAFELILDFLKQRYPYVTMRVENKNQPMLKFAMKAGFVIDGISYFKNKIYLEHILEVSDVVVTTSSNGCDVSTGCSAAS